MTQQPVVNEAKVDVNRVGLTRQDYRGAPSTLCQGCGHNSIAGQIISACYELDLIPEKVVKFSGIGCSSKSPNYFLGRSFGFNGLHGRMPSLASGVSFADTSLQIIGVSGDGDTASIGMGQFKHAVRRNTPMVYVIENNGVYGLTKGQYSATAEQGIEIKHHGKTKYLPVDLCIEALSANATFVARSFAGDPKQVRELLKAAFHHKGVAVLDIISPCMTFHNMENSIHSYTGGRDHETPIHNLSFVPKQKEIMIDNFEQGSVREVFLHDGSMVLLKKLEKDYDPCDKAQAYQILEDSHKNGWLVTGLIYIDPIEPTLHDHFNLIDRPLNRLKNEEIRPSVESLEKINAMML